jgi:general secretion pathway protein J
MNRGPAAAHRTASSHGFTLVEILVVITLLSVVVLAMGAALRTFAQTETRLDGRLTVSDEFRSATSFIKATLGRASVRKPELAEPIAASADARPTDNAVLFAADAHSVAWIGVAPARYGAGGLTYFKLAVEPSGGDSNLVIRFTACDNSAAFPPWADAEARVLVAAVTAFDLLYEDSRAAPGIWSATWNRSDRLPDRLKIQLRTAQAVWPEIIIAPRTLPGAGDRSSRFTVGGSS